MKVTGPNWHIKGVVCPCCGQGNPEFIACPACEQIALACLELGTVFPEPSNLRIHLAPEANCIKCGGVRFSQFKPATTEQLLNSGFGGAYE
jgi:hypothetical protein